VFLISNTTAYSQRIYVENAKLKVNNNQFFLNGSNTPWISWNDFGISRFNQSNWDAAFKDLADYGVNSTRVGISCNGEMNPLQISDSGYVNGPSELFLQNLDSLVSIASKYKIYLMTALISFDHTKEGNPYWERWRAMYDKKENMDSFVENYAVKIAKRYNNNPYFFSIDVCNEIMWVSESETNDRGNYEWSTLQYLVGKTAQRVHEESDVLVCVSNYLKYTSPNYSGNKWSDNALQTQVNDEDAYVDFYKIHYYSWVYPWFGGFHFEHEPSFYGLDSKPCITGEISAEGAYSELGGTRTYNHSLSEAYEKHYINGWQGCMAWTSNGVDSHGDIHGPHGEATIAFKNKHYRLVYPLSTDTLYKLEVINGNGSGEYIEGAKITITANPAPNGQQFKEWSGADVDDKYNSTTFITIQKENISITATYENIPVNISDIDKGNILVYPNPSYNSSFNIIGLEANKTLNIYNVMGELIYTNKTPSENIFSIRLGEVPNGIYFLEIEQQVIKLLCK